MKRNWEILPGSCFRLKKAFWEIPTGTQCTIYSVGTEGVTMEFEYIGNLIPRNIIRCMSNREMLGHLRPESKTSSGPP